MNTLPCVTADKALASTAPPEPARLFIELVTPAIALPAAEGSAAAAVFCIVLATLSNVACPPIASPAKVAAITPPTPISTLLYDA